jgi:Holliday junction resolvasome RuvABC ATP-dependent DNA helicase subunit
MEDRALDLMIGEGPSARSVRIDLPRFTLVGATTRQGLLTTPLRDRFGIPVRLNFYTVAELVQVVRRAARLLGADLTEDGAEEVARRSRGTPRIAGRLLRRVRDFAHAAGDDTIDAATADRALDLMIGEGPSARSVRIDLPRFTLVGATTRQGLLTTPLRDRFGIPVRLNFYTVEELEQVVRRAARLLAAELTEDGAREIARRSRGTPRIAGRLLRRVRDFAHAAGADAISAEAADRALSRLEIDSLGLDAMDRRYLGMIADLYGGGPVGVETLAAGLSEPRDTIEDVIEPSLIQLGLIARTARGRCLNGRGYAHLGLPQPQGSQTGLFDGGAV